MNSLLLASTILANLGTIAIAYLAFTNNKIIKSFQEENEKSLKHQHNESTKLISCLVASNLVDSQRNGVQKNFFYFKEQLARFEDYFLSDRNESPNKTS
jgi:hypothetical protein